VEIDVITQAGSTLMDAVGGMMQTDLKALGIKVNLQPLNFNVVGDKVSNALDWDAAIFSLSSGDLLEPNDGANVYKSNGRLHLFDQRLPDKNGNIDVTDARPWEKRLDQIFNEGSTTLDKAKRHQLYDEFQQIIYDQAPFIFLISPTSLVAARNTLGNFDPTPLSQLVGGVHNLEEMYKTDAAHAKSGKSAEDGSQIK